MKFWLYCFLLHALALVNVTNEDEYCDFNKEHTMCIYQERSSRLQKVAQRWIDQCIYRHDKLRNEIAVVVTFFICWAPFHAQRLLAMYLRYFQGSKVNDTMLVMYTSLLHVSGILYFLSTTVNPFLYNIMSHKFRLAFRLTLTRTCSLRTCSNDKRSPYGTLRQNSQRTMNGSMKVPSRRPGQGTAMVLLTHKNGHIVRTNSQPTLSTYADSRKHSDSSEGNNNKSKVLETALVSAKHGRYIHKFGSKEIGKSRSDGTFCYITRKIRDFPRKKLFCNNSSRTDSLGTTSLKEPLGKVLSSGGQTISNSSLLDLDLSEFTSSELAEIMGQMKEEPQTIRVNNS